MSVPVSKIDVAAETSHDPLFAFFASRALSFIIFGALFCTLAVKFFFALQTAKLGEYPGWILADLIVLLAIEFALSAVCSFWHRKWLFRAVLLIAALVCTWSVTNAGWLIATGTQILPAVLLPLVRDPLNALAIVVVNLWYRPVAAFILLAPSAIALAFFFTVLAKPPVPKHGNNAFVKRMILLAVFVTILPFTHTSGARNTSTSILSEGLRYNCQLKAIQSIFLPPSRHAFKIDSSPPTRKVPTCDKIKILSPSAKKSSPYNIVLLVLEGIQYEQTSLSDKASNLTPFLVNFADQGVEFTNARCIVTHTTKALFSILTGRFPSVSQDIIEAHPVDKPYCGLVTILSTQLNFRTAFFQSAKGNFECRPGLVYNLGFDKFWSRESLTDTSVYVGYLGSDEFSMLAPIEEWLLSDSRPFFLTILCSVSHDPYEVPPRFCPIAREPLSRYRQTISYTDAFIGSFDVLLRRLDLHQNTIFCIIGDHGEAFGEHGLSGHDRISFDEVLRIAWLIRAPGLIQPGLKIPTPCGLTDLTPTLLPLLGLEIPDNQFDGLNGLGLLPQNRKLYFSSWLQHGPAGLIEAARKVVYDPTTEQVLAYNLDKDPRELNGLQLPAPQARQIIDEVTSWRKATIFQPPSPKTGSKLLWGSWMCSWTNRKAWAKYAPSDN